MKYKHALVTANFLSRGSDHPWLIREKNQKSKEVKDFKAVVAKNVEFKLSDISGFESQHGCTIVAHCRTAEGFAVDPVFDKNKVVRLRYCRYAFQDYTTGKEVPKLDTLYLTSDGHMYGELPKSLLNTLLAPFKKVAKKEELVEVEN